MTLFLLKLTVTFFVIAFILANIANFVSPSRVEDRLKMVAGVFVVLCILSGSATLILGVWSL
jgi:hypothetical protein